MTYVVTLVHGTWASGTTWIRENSSMCRELKALLPSPVIVEPFRWSGRNSFSARRKATGELVIHLRQLLQRWPEAYHYVVAHSHGGNVALNALRDGDLNRGVVGIACLATPFLHIRPRDLGPYGSEHLGCMSLLLVSVFGGVAAAVATQWLPVVTRLPAFVGWLLSGAGGIAAILGALQWQRWGSKLVAEFALPEIAAGRLLIVRTTGDEAQAALAGTQVVGWLSMRVWLAFSRVAGRAEGVRGPWRILLAYPAAFLTGLAAFLLVPVVGLVSVLLFAFGPGLALAGPFVDIAVEATPPGSWTVHQLPRFDGQRLSHSHSYDDPRAFRLIAEWMRFGRN